MRYLVLTTLVGCAAATSPAHAPTTSTAAPAAHVAARTAACPHAPNVEHAGIYGRAVIDRHPVKAFDVVVVRDLMAPWVRHTFVTNDGCFALTDLASGSWKLIIDAHGDTRELDLFLAEGEMRPLGTLALHRGLNARGRVVDSTGRPVAQALVTASTSAVGRHGVTDSLGQFAFADITPGRGSYPDPLVLQAMAPGLMTAKRVQVTSDAPVDVVIVPTGTIEGTITGARPRDFLWFEGSDGEGVSTRLDDKGAFRVVAPIGTYRVLLYSKQLGSVTVIAGQTSALTLLARPSSDVTIRSQRACKDVELRTTTGVATAQSTCVGPRAWFKDIPAGAYDLCVDGSCQRIQVDDAHALFEVP